MHMRVNMYVPTHACAHVSLCVHLCTCAPVCACARFARAAAAKHHQQGGLHDRHFSPPSSEARGLWRPVAPGPAGVCLSQAVRETPVWPFSWLLVNLWVPRLAEALPQSLCHLHKGSSLCTCLCPNVPSLQGRESHWVWAHPNDLAVTRLCLCHGPSYVPQKFVCWSPSPQHLGM